MLAELKTLHCGTSTYPADATARCGAVAARAASLNTEYARKAKKIDRDFCGSAPGDAGPVEARLRTFGPTSIKGLVFGAFAVASSDVHELLTSITKKWAQPDTSSACRCRVQSKHKAPLAWLIKRRWGSIAARANARLTSASGASPTHVLFTRRKGFDTGCLRSLA